MQFQDKLNPKLWEGFNLKPEVADKLKEIANAFIEYLNIDEDAVQDIRITGSSANYNYNDLSDLDLHLIIDYDKLHEDCPLVEGYLWGYKSQFNDNHDISIYGIPVEVYAENMNQPAVSNGTYSLVQGDWIHQPEKIEPTDNDAAVEAKYNELKEMVDNCDDSEEAQNILDRIYDMRKVGLADAGEFSTENLAFKKLRNEGCMEKLRKIKKEQIDKQLSLESYNEEETRTTQEQLFYMFQNWAIEAFQELGYITEKPIYNVKQKYPMIAIAHAKGDFLVMYINKEDLDKCSSIYDFNGYATLVTDGYGFEDSWISLDVENEKSSIEEIKTAIDNMVYEADVNLRPKKTKRKEFKQEFLLNESIKEDYEDKIYYVEYDYSDDAPGLAIGSLKVKAKSEEEALKKAEKHAAHKHPGYYIEDSCRIVDNTYTNVDLVESMKRLNKKLERIHEDVIPAILDSTIIKYGSELDDESFEKLVTELSKLIKNHRFITYRDLKDELTQWRYTDEMINKLFAEVEKRSGIKNNMVEAVEIETKNPGILEVPEGKNVEDLPQSHFEKLVKKKGYEEIIRALTNLEVWNKNKNKPLSKWASNMADKLKKKFRPEDKNESLTKSMKLLNKKLDSFFS